jgi:hypothetical protein
MKSSVFGQKNADGDRDQRLRTRFIVSSLVDSSAVSSPPSECASGMQDQRVEGRPALGGCFGRLRPAVAGAAHAACIVSPIESTA